jgi:hypothetical protein
MWVGHGLNIREKPPDTSGAIFPLRGHFKVYWKLENFPKNYKKWAFAFVVYILYWHRKLSFVDFVGNYIIFSHS